MQELALLMGADGVDAREEEFARLVKQARAEGFLVFQFADRYPQGIAQMAQWLKEGKLKYREDIVNGFENTVRAFIGLLKGDNTGKMLVRVAGG